jgi:hypothetical protein
MANASEEIRDELVALFEERHSAEDVEQHLPELSDAQMAAIFGLLVEQVTGRASGDDEPGEGGDRPTSQEPEAASTPPKSRSASRSRGTSRRARPKRASASTS